LPVSPSVVVSERNVANSRRVILRGPAPERRGVALGVALLAARGTVVVVVVGAVPSRFEVCSSAGTKP
jgi:hypothetical protein